MAVRYNLKLGLQAEFTSYRNCLDRNLTTACVCAASPGHDRDAATGGNYKGVIEDDGARHQVGERTLGRARHELNRATISGVAAFYLSEYTKFILVVSCNLLILKERGFYLFLRPTMVKNLQRRRDQREDTFHW